MEKNKPEELRYASFLFLQMDAKFRHLLSNEKIAAKQEFENEVAHFEENLFLRTYSLQGLKAGCDMLLWLMAADLRPLQKCWTRISTAGAGKYLSIAQSYIGLYHSTYPAVKKEAECAPKNFMGKHRYMLLHPIVRAHTWYELSEQERLRFMSERTGTLDKYKAMSEHFFHSYGLDDQELLVVREANSLPDLADASRELRDQRLKMFTVKDTPNMLCVGTDLRDILDSLG